ncbi:ABC transporter ATP-binding protein [Magnetococcus sp. PR-3]|uniref:ABC transporter ATP-binding protein n=1 Tax=Magnetococcus sp. PR-3 TaxID=3120355 RepID=UPI002FCE4A18
MNAITCENLSKRYQRRGPAALDGVSLTIEQGQTFALLGHNGAGKSTLMKLALGLMRNSGGSLAVLGQDPRGRDAQSLRQQIGFLPENVAFQGNMTGLETLAFYARLKGVDIKQCESLLEEVGLPTEARNRAVGGYSKGMRQRLGLAQMLLGEPKLLLMDEPTTGLDPAQRLAMFDRLQVLQKQYGVTIIISTHHLPELEGRCDRAAILRRGKLVLSGSLDRMRREADLPVTVQVMMSDEEGPIQLAERLGRAHSRINGHALKLSCPDHDTAALISDIHGVGIALSDIHIERPSLDAVYFHHCQQADQQEGMLS